MVLLAEADQHGWALDYRLRVLCGQGSLCSGTWGYSLGSSRWGYFGLASLQGIQNMYLPVGEGCSFIPLFLDDGKLRTVLGMGVQWWKRRTQSLLLGNMAFGQCLLPFCLYFSLTSMAALLLLVFFWAQICATPCWRDTRGLMGQATQVSTTQTWPESCHCVVIAQAHPACTLLLSLQVVILMATPYAELVVYKLVPCLMYELDVAITFALEMWKQV